MYSTHIDEANYLSGSTYVSKGWNIFGGILYLIHFCFRPGLISQPPHFLRTLLHGLPSSALPTTTNQPAIVDPVPIPNADAGMVSLPTQSRGRSFACCFGIFKHASSWVRGPKHAMTNFTGLFTWIRSASYVLCLILTYDLVSLVRCLSFSCDAWLRVHIGWFSCCRQQHRYTHYLSTSKPLQAIFNNTSETRRLFQLRCITYRLSFRIYQYSIQRE